MVLIDLVQARQILDSRGVPTVETTVTLSDGTSATASAPAGQSKSSYEALELRDKDFSYYFGEGVTHAAQNVNQIIAPRMKKMNPLEQEKIDKVLLELDGTPNKAHLGANAILSVSIAVTKVGAKLSDQTLFFHLNELFKKTKALNKYEEEIHLAPEQAEPKLSIPLFNLINGGAHADNALAVQEFWLVPHKIGPTAERIRAGAEVYWNLKQVLAGHGKPTDVGDEGGFGTGIETHRQALEFLREATSKAGYNQEVAFGMDVAVENFSLEAAHEYVEPLEEYRKTIHQFPMLALEDPFSENDWENFKTIKQMFTRGLIIGDDLISMQRERLLKAIEEEAINGVIIKPNQIGTVSETLSFAKVAKDAGVALVASHRSGETNDTFISDLAVAIGADFLKAGAPARGERTGKYNRLMEIAQRLE